MTFQLLLVVHSLKHTLPHTYKRVADVPKLSLILLSDTLSCHCFHFYWPIQLVSELVNISSCLSLRLQVAGWHVIDADHSKSIWILASAVTVKIIQCKCAAKYYVWFNKTFSFLFFFFCHIKNENNILQQVERFWRTLVAFNFTHVHRSKYSCCILNLGKNTYE